MTKKISKVNHIIWIFILLLLCLSAVLLMTGCMGEAYQVDYCGQKEIYTDARDTYRAGAKVELNFKLTEADKDYMFYLDDQQIQYNRKEGNAITVEFTMPNNDITLKCFEKNSPQAIENPVSLLLVDYYRSQLASEGYDGHFEMVLSTSEKSNQARLDVYYKESGEAEESCVSYIVPYQAVEDCYAVIEKHKMSEWNKMKDSISIDGALEVCKFLKDGAYVRATTEAMPENGMEAIEEVGDVMSGYISEERRVSD